jgi:methyl-accepting chemotaxis protein
MSESTLSSSPRDPSGAFPPRVARRKYLIDPKRQLRTASLATLLVVILLVFVNVGFYFLRLSQTSTLSTAAPQLTPVLREQDSALSLSMIGLSVILAATVFFVTIVETHRTAGAVFAVKQRIERVRDGDYRVALKLRSRDNLQDLEVPFNEMVRSLRRRALDDASSIEELAVAAEGMQPGGADLSRALHDLAVKKREIAS